MTDDELVDGVRALLERAKKDDEAADFLYEIRSLVDDVDDEVGSESGYESEEMLHAFEVRCVECGVILSTSERGPDWQQEFYSRSMKCSRCLSSEDEDDDGDDDEDEDDEDEADYCYASEEVRCWECGALLTTQERGPHWHYQEIYSPRSMKCSRCQR